MDIFADLGFSARLHFLFQFLSKNIFSVWRDLSLKMGHGGLNIGTHDFFLEPLLDPKSSVYN